MASVMKRGSCTKGSHGFQSSIFRANLRTSWSPFLFSIGCDFSEARRKLFILPRTLIYMSNPQKTEHLVSVVNTPSWKVMANITQ
ncbi:hypothetical protein E2C01_004683 [Portunus trituberculatus]|uniref:Uncharacterized protein n=1 Tax=Portunus trituberculatus TaxID=210409 RepID=A0A5B7CUL1_PORTR|nr:hypothetical protein [Portunus trituberculatus]